MQTQTLDPIWEEKYRAGHMERYPWDAVVTFIYRNAPRDRPRREVHIVEIGCGAANNLWFAAREGFAVAGIDGSASAIGRAKERFAAEGLEGELVVGDFAETLPFADARFDLAIDRGAIVCTGFSVAKNTVEEVHRILKPGGKFLFNPYSRAHTSYAKASAADDNLVRDICAGALTDVGQLCFYDETMVRESLASGWEIESLTHVEHTDLACIYASDAAEVHAEWRVIARKSSSP